MSLSNNYPTTRPTLNFDFANTNVLDARISFSRDSIATFTNSNGLIQTAQANVPRFDYDPVTLAARGLLIEESRTNLLTYSEQFANVAWTKIGANTTGNVIVAPDGTLTGDKVYEEITNTAHYARQSYTSTIGTTYTSSVFLKAAERTSAVVIHYDGQTFCGVSVNLSTGVLSAPPVDLSITNASADATVASVGNGWYRVSVARAQVSTTTTQLRVSTQKGSDGIYLGDGVSGIYVWGAQLEAGAFATSYISTVASQVTRSADVASVNTLSPWYNATEGTLYGEVANAAPQVGGTARRIANLNDGTEGDCIVVSWSGGNGISAAFVTDNSVDQATFLNPGGSAYPFPTKVALAYKAADFQAAVNGTTFASVTSGTVPTVSQMRIGDVVAGATGPQNINGHIRRVTYYPVRLSNTNLQALTS